MDAQKISTSSSKPFERASRTATFVKLTLGNYEGTDASLQKILVRLVTTKKGTRLYSCTAGPPRQAKNYEFETGVTLIDEAFENGFRSAHPSRRRTISSSSSAKRASLGMNTGKPTFPHSAHRTQPRKENPELARQLYLRSLGITDDNGRVRDREQDKFRQVDKFVEILAT